MEAVLPQVVFTLAERSYRWEEVVAAARQWGDWQRLEADVREGIALVRRAEQEGGLPSQAQMDAAASEFRYARDLLSADETEAWLSRWGLELDDWLDYLRRSLLRARLEGDAPGSEAVGPEPAATWAEAVCSGELERLARKLADRAAVYASIEDEPPGLDRLPQMEERFERFRGNAVTPQRLADELSANLLEWTRVDCLWAATPSEAVAREVALCVREDYRDFGEVAAEAGLAAEERRLYMDGVEPQLAPHLLGARAGDLLGPLPRDGEFVLILVRERAAPSTDDPELRARAERRVADRAVETEVLRRVRWQGSS